MSIHSQCETCRNRDKVLVAIAILYGKMKTMKMINHCCGGLHRRFYYNKQLLLLSVQWSFSIVSLKNVKFRNRLICAILLIFYLKCESVLDKRNILEFILYVLRIISFFNLTVPARELVQVPANERTVSMQRISILFLCSLLKGG